MDSAGRIVVPVALYSALRPLSADIVSGHGANPPLRTPQKYHTRKQTQTVRLEHTFVGFLHGCCAFLAVGFVLFCPSLLYTVLRSGEEKACGSLFSLTPLDVAIAWLMCS